MECLNELSALLAVRHLDVALLAVLATRYCIPEWWPTVLHHICSCSTELPLDPPTQKCYIVCCVFKFFTKLHHDVVQKLCTPLHDAAQNGHNSVVEYLIRSGANVNAVDNVSCFIVGTFNTCHHDVVLGSSDSITCCYSKWS